MRPIRVGILTASDRASIGERDDISGDTIEEMIGEMGWTLAVREIVPDDEDEIATRLKYYGDELRVDLVLTTGGTGLSPRDVTPEATRQVIDRDAPGFAEAMRAASLSKTPHAMLSRAVSGIRSSTLIINLPGSPRAVRENLEVILPALPHGLEKLCGDEGECAT